MMALGLAGMPAKAWSSPRDRARADTRVIILGAGVTGLAAAYELKKLGYDCEILEARPRVGGRAFTARRGQQSEEEGPPQTASFDSDLYLNAGAARIPHHHKTTLDYCRELGVAIEAFCSVNEASYVFQTKGVSQPRRLRLREARADWRGESSEMLAKAITSDALDQPLSTEDRERMLEWLRAEGGLDASFKYVGSARRGYTNAPGVGASTPVVGAPVALSELLSTGFGRYLATDLNLQTPMFQIVGGTDNLPKALAAKVGRATHGANVRAIEQPDGKIRVRYTAADGSSKQAEGAFCISTLPLTILRDVSLDVAPEFRAAISAINYSNAGKIALQFSRRFWEEDDGIFGGITRTDQEITQILYPSTGYLSRKGILVGYYQTGAVAGPTGDLAPAERLQRAMDQGALIHPQYRSAFENAFSIAWQKVAFSKGGWAQFTEAQRKHEYLKLLEPDGSLYLAGDYTTNLSGWLCGALESARAVVSAIHERARRSMTATRAERN
jgi:monoamine oxidase